MTRRGRTGAMGAVGAMAPALLSAVGLAMMLAGCTTTTASRSTAAGGEIRTSSDATSADRRASVRMELASAYFARGQYTTALDEVKLALAAKPELPEAFSLRGLIYASLGQPELAEQSFRRALQLAPRDAATMQNFGWFLCQQQRYAEADAQFMRALEQPQYRDAPRTLLAQGLCQARAGNLAQAERTLSRAYEQDPTNPAIAFNLSEVLMRIGELERARFYIRRVNSQPEQSNAQTLWLAARIEYRLGNMDGVQQFGNQLRERFPQSTEALQFERGRFDD
jgi:type IV pilus assembly protein PilF